MNKSEELIGENEIEERVKEKLVEEINNACNKDSLPEVIDKSDEDKNVREEEPRLSKDITEKLSTGLLSVYVDDLQSTARNLSELTKNQSILIETIQQENTRFSDCTNLYHLDDLFARAKHYQTKLQNIKKEMAILHERSNKLKKRALKLQQQKQKEALQREQQKEWELEREKQLMPKFANKS